MLICWDLAFPEAFRELISKGAKIIIIPCFWGINDCSKEGLAWNPSSEALFLDSMLTARTFENTCGNLVQSFP
jgi:predicted amidohydrolase